MRISWADERALQSQNAESTMPPIRARLEISKDRVRQKGETTCEMFQRVAEDEEIETIPLVFPKRFWPPT